MRTKTTLTVKIASDVVRLKKEAEDAKDERRKIRNELVRLFQEVKYVNSKNNKRYKLLRRRQEDTDEHLRKIKKYSEWAIKLLISILLTIIVGAFVGFFIR
jgi:hypothetical protein